ncbi:MAG: hypothetical protein ACRYG4_23245 [Janthinobacterium lividum]
MGFLSNRTPALGLPRVAAVALGLGAATLGALGVIAPGRAGAAELQRGSDGLALSVKTDGTVADTANFTGGAGLMALLGSVQADVSGSVETGRSLIGTDYSIDRPGSANSAWRGTGLSLKAGWTTDAVQVALASTRSNRRTTSLTDMTSALPTEAQVSADDEQSTTISATMKPWRTIDLQVGAESTRTTIEAGTGASTSLQQSTGNRSLFSTLRWRATPTLALEVGTRLGRDELTGIANGLVTGVQTSVQPHVSATFQSPDGAKWSFAAQRIVAPPSLSAFAAEATASDRAFALRPEGAWQFQGGVERRLSTALTFTTGVTVDDQDGSSESALIAGNGPVLANVGAGLRKQVDLGLAADLKGLGLAGATLTGKGTWRASSVDDPLTGENRRASGERPYEGTVVFAQALPVANAKWGLDAYVAGPADLYSLTDATHVAAAAGLGGFVDYNAGRVRLRLRIDNLVGGDRVSRTDVYDGLRGMSGVARYDQSIDDGRAVSISLSSRL